MAQQRIAVVGRGLIGSAAAKYLAESGAEVTLIGPSEPTDWAAHSGVFASHYDEGRITRQLDADPFWSRVSRASIARYRAIESESAVPFFSEVGGLIAGAKDSDLIRNVAAVAEAAQIPCDWLDAEGVAAHFPYLKIGAQDRASYEARSAGHISPRRLVLAQGVLAAARGAAVLEEEVQAIDEKGDSVVLRIGGQAMRFDRVLVAAGAFCRQLLGDHAAEVTPYKRTVALFALDAAEAARLQNMPTLIHKTGTDDPYILPPIRYPDGQTYLKLGGDPVDLPAATPEDLAAWYRSGGSEEVGAYLTDVILRRIPDLRFTSRHVAACATTFTPEDKPRIEPVSDRVCAAMAGCGRGAKCSDELGRMAAEAVLTGKAACVAG